MEDEQVTYAKHRKKKRSNLKCEFMEGGREESRSRSDDLPDDSGGVIVERLNKKGNYLR